MIIKTVMIWFKLAFVQRLKQALLKLPYYLKVKYQKGRGYILAWEKVYLVKLVVFRCLSITAHATKSIETNKGKIANHENSGIVGVGFLVLEGIELLLALC